MYHNVLPFIGVFAPDSRGVNSHRACRHRRLVLKVLTDLEGPKEEFGAHWLQIRGVGSITATVQIGQCVDTLQEMLSAYFPVVDPFAFVNLAVQVVEGCTELLNVEITICRATLKFLAALRPLPNGSEIALFKRRDMSSFQPLGELTSQGTLGWQSGTT